MRLIRVLLLCLLLTGVFGAAAQDDALTPLMRVLASVPDTPEARAAFSYADYAAIIGDAEGDDRFPPLLEVYSGPPLEYATLRIDDQERLIGVPFFAIEQAATWGTPPPFGTLFQGAFPAEAVQAAYEAREYTESDLNGFPLFCGPDGCDSGMSLNLDLRNPGDPFGGELGRPQPVLFVPLEGDQAQLLSSPVLDVVQASAGAAAGEVPSLADSVEVQAAIRAASGDGVLRQAAFAGAESIGPAPEEAEALPPYSLAVLAETETVDGLHASVTLVYGTLAEAEEAAAALETRLEAYVSLRTQQSYTDLLKERGLRVSYRAVEDADTGLAVAQVVFTGPDDAGAFRLLVQGLTMRDLGWLGS